MKIKAIDLGLMSEHLTVHKGVLKKIKLYQSLVKHEELKRLFQLQYEIMKSHVVVMLQLIDPHYTGEVMLPNIDSFRQSMAGWTNWELEPSIHDRDIATEMVNTTKNMANTNFMSALMMETKKVKQIHFEMALQQVEIEFMYKDIMEKMGWSFAPDASEKEQMKTLQYFKDLYHIKA
ncbi:hypothetical protein GCM10008967_06120 [Bacillus carboniphilus]|uniref:Spore coat protein n=1 Tax=Bacillus carboniphilus TaxID=86663 RepID=A0ABP3FHT7_9BACI